MNEQAGWGHEKPAEEIFSVKKLIPHLCDLAYANRQHTDKLHPEMCVACISPCKYGERLIEFLKKDGRDYGQMLNVVGRLERRKQPDIRFDYNLQKRLLRHIGRRTDW